MVCIVAQELVGRVVFDCLASWLHESICKFVDVRLTHCIFAVSHIGEIFYAGLYCSLRGGVVFCMFSDVFEF